MPVEDTGLFFYIPPPFPPSSLLLERVFEFARKTHLPLREDVSYIGQKKRRKKLNKLKSLVTWKKERKKQCCP